MLNIRLKVSSIDYPATFHTLYPLLSGHFTKAEGQNLLKSLIAALGGNAEKVFVSWLPYLEETERRKLIAGILNRNSPRLTPLLNEKLQSSEVGKYIRLGTVGAALAGDDFTLELDGIEIDLLDLLDTVSRKVKLNPLMVLGIKGLFKMDPTLVEKKGAELLSSVPDVKGEILKALQNALTERGIAVSVEDLDVSYSPRANAPLADSPGRGKLLDAESEKIIVDALARYLIENAGRETQK